MVGHCRVCAQPFEPATDDSLAPECLRGAAWTGSRCAQCVALASRRVAVEAIARVRIAIARDMLTCNPTKTDEKAR